MAGDVFFNNGINVASGGNKLLNALLSVIANESDVQTDYAGYKEDLMFYEQQALSLDEKFSGIAGPLEIDTITENGVKSEGTRTKLPDKGFEIVEYGEKLTTSFLMYEWLKVSRSISGASADIKKEWKTIARDAKFLIEGAMMRMSIDMTNVYAKGFGTPTATYGAGSPTPKGKPLFSVLHTARNGALTWRNMGTGSAGSYLNADLAVADGKAVIQNALDVMKTVMRLENGYKIARPKKGMAFELLVSSADYPVAGEILNADSSGTPITWGGAATGDNAHQTNTFMLAGNKIKLVELELLGDIDKNGNTIGSETMWFLRNPRYVQKTKCFKCVKLYNPRIKNYSNDDTDAQIVDIRIGYAVDHYGAECGIFGSLGDNSAYTV